MAVVAFLGGGNMAQGMVLRLLQAGHHVRVFNRTPEKLHPLAKAGAVVAKSPKEAATAADVVISMVSDDNASRRMWCDDDGALAAPLRKGAIAVECSTLSHGWVMDLARVVESKGVRFLDTPVTGLPDAAMRGQLKLLVGGDRETLEEARPFLTPLCQEIIHFGPSGSGIKFKLILNLMGTVQIAAMAEAMLMAEAAGLDLEKVLSTLSNGVAAAPQVVRIGKNIVADDHSTNIIFAAKWRLKDASYGVEMADDLQQQAALGHTAQSLFDAAVKMGFGDSNESVIFHALRAVSGGQKPRAAGCSQCKHSPN